MGYISIKGIGTHSFTVGESLWPPPGEVLKRTPTQIYRQIRYYTYIFMIPRVIWRFKCSTLFFWSRSCKYNQNFYCPNKKASHKRCKRGIWMWGRNLIWSLPPSTSHEFTHKNPPPYGALNLFPMVVFGFLVKCSLEPNYWVRPRVHHTQDFLSLPKISHGENLLCQSVLPI